MLGDVVFLALRDEFMAVAVFLRSEGVEHLGRIAEAEAALDGTFCLGWIERGEGPALDGGGGEIISLGEGGAGHEGAGCEYEERFHNLYISRRCTDVKPNAAGWQSNPDTYRTPSSE